MPENKISSVDIPAIKCPFCKSNFRYLKRMNGAGVVSCKEHKFPEINGILYLKRDKLANMAVKNILHGRALAAYINLLNLNRKMLIPFLLLNSKIRISFKKFIYLIRIAGYDKKWSRYILKRTRSDSYKATRHSIKMLKKGGKVLDFGCGVGQLLVPLAKIVGPKNLYAIDSSFVNLMIARKFFASRQATLICSDGKYGLPFSDKSLHAITATDSFHYVDKKAVFVKECERILKPKGRLMIFQTINAMGVVFDNIKAITIDNFIQILIKNKFQKINVFSNQGKTIKHINEKEPYNISAVK